MGRFLALVLLAAVGVACSGDDGFDRDAAVETVMETSPDPIDREQAECYVDRVADEVGVGALDPDRELGPEQVRRMAAVRIDCVGAANVGLSRPEGPPLIGEDGSPVPWEHGDDPELDSWWDACEAGDRVACDRLFEDAPLGSVYEWFGATCGDTRPRPVCSDPPDEP